MEIVQGVVSALLFLVACALCLLGLLIELMSR